jgi:archaellum component FlaC
MEYKNFSNKCIPFWNRPTKVLEMKVQDINEQIERINSLSGDTLDFINATRITATLIETRNSIQNQIEERKKQNG